MADGVGKFLAPGAVRGSALGLAGSRIAPAQRRPIAWFGIRGIGSI